MAKKDPRKPDDRSIGEMADGSTAARAKEEAAGEDPNDTSDLDGLIGDNEYNQLRQSLEIVEKAAIAACRPLTPRQRKALAIRINGAVLAYRGIKFKSDAASRFTLHKLAEPLESVITMLACKENIPDVLIALGASPLLWTGPHQESVHRATTRYERLLSDLRKISTNLPPSPAKRRRGKPSANDLHDLVRRLADCWQLWTGKDFTRDWHQGEPASDAMHFVCAIMKVVDQSSLGKLPTVTKNIVAELKRATAQKRAQAASPKPTFQ